jgi:hypothetical protein
VIGGEGEGGGEFGAGEGGGVGDDRLHVVAEGLVGGVGEEGGVGAAGVGDQDAAELLQGFVELRGFGGEVHWIHCRSGGRVSVSRRVEEFDLASGEKGFSMALFQSWFVIRFDAVTSGVFFIATDVDCEVMADR